jgi:Rrf2 family iron-sulfur cluster assembly transcriptional regulator
MRALCYLASHTNRKPISIQTICDSEDIPIRYLEQIMAKLRKWDIVKSYRGPSGGYQLAIPASELSIARILKALEGKICLVWCTGDKRTEKECPQMNTCRTYPFWFKLNEGLAKFLEETSLESVVNTEWNQKKVSFLLS